jgi:hypothetical protein
LNPPVVIFTQSRSWDFPNQTGSSGDNFYLSVQQWAYGGYLALLPEFKVIVFGEIKVFFPGYSRA